MTSYSKYKARRESIDGYLFDSQAEAARYRELKLLERAGQIRQLRVHPRYEIVVNGQKICVVEADFEFYDQLEERMRVIDVKGLDLPISRLKRKLVKVVFAIEIEVEHSGRKRKRSRAT